MYTTTIDRFYLDLMELIDAMNHPTQNLMDVPPRVLTRVR